MTVQRIELRTLRLLFNMSILDSDTIEKKMVGLLTQRTMVSVRQKASILHLQILMIL